MTHSLPSIPGLLLRQFRDESDYQAMVEVQERCREYDQIDPFSTLERIPEVSELATIIQEDHCNPTADIVMVEMNGEVIGYGLTKWWTETDGTWLYLHLGYLVPGWRGKGIGGTMLLWLENHIKEIASNHGVSERRMYGANATTTEKEATALLTFHGYQPMFSLAEMGFDTIHPTSELQLSDGITLIPVDASHLRQIWEANNQVYAGRAFISVPTEEDYQEFIKNPRNDYSLWHVAWSGNQIAGLVLSEVIGDTGVVSQVSTLPAYRKRGIATALLNKNLMTLKAKGVKAIRLHTSGENVAGAKSLYEKVGFKFLKSHIRYRKVIG